MAKFLIQANYVGEGISGLLKEGGSRRRAAVADLFKSVQGTLESYYFAFGDQDVFIIGDLPDNATAAALTLKVNAAGMASCRTTVLLTPEEIDDAVKKNMIYRPPGFQVDPGEVAKWDNEGGHLSQD